MASLEDKLPRDLAPCLLRFLIAAHKAYGLRAIRGRKRRPVGTTGLQRAVSFTEDLGGIRWRYWHVRRVYLSQKTLVFETPLCSYQTRQYSFTSCSAHEGFPSKKSVDFSAGML